MLRLALCGAGDRSEFYRVRDDVQPSLSRPQDFGFSQSKIRRRERYFGVNSNLPRPCSADILVYVSFDHGEIELCELPAPLEENSERRGWHIYHSRGLKIRSLVFIENVVLCIKTKHTLYGKRNFVNEERELWTLRKCRH